MFLFSQVDKETYMMIKHWHLIKYKIYLENNYQIARYLSMADWTALSSNLAGLSNCMLKSSFMPFDTSLVYFRFHLCCRKHICEKTSLCKIYYCCDCWHPLFLNSTICILYYITICRKELYIILEQIICDYINAGMKF